MSYKEKYQKYKEKYLSLKGGISSSYPSASKVIVFFSGNKNKVKEVEEAFNKHIGTDLHCLHVDIDIEEVQSVSVTKVIEQKMKDSLKELLKVKDKLYLDSENGKEYVLQNIDKKNIILLCEDTGLGFEKAGLYTDELETLGSEKRTETSFYPGALIKFAYGAQKGIAKKTLSDKKQIMHKANQLCVKLYNGSKFENITGFGLKVDDLQEVFLDKMTGVVSKKYKKDGSGFDFDYFLEPDGKGNKTVSQLIDEGNIDKPRFNIINNHIIPELVKKGIKSTLKFNSDKDLKFRKLIMDN